MGGARPHRLDEARPEERRPNHHSLLLTLNERGVGTTRLDDLGDGTGIITLVAITAPLRGNGHGRVLGAMVEDCARELGIGALFVSAVSDAEGFYAATGWTCVEGDAPALLGHADGCVPMSKRIAG